MFHGRYPPVADSKRIRCPGAASRPPCAPPWAPNSCRRSAIPSANRTSAGGRSPCTGRSHRPSYFLDERVGCRTHGGMVAPAEFNPFAWAVAERSRRRVGDAGRRQRSRPAREDGRHRRSWPEVSAQRRPGDAIRRTDAPADVITSVRRLGAYSEREGRLGLMLFGQTDEVWTNQRGEFVKRIINTVIRY